MQLYTRSELYDLDQKVQAKIDEVLDDENMSQDRRRHRVERLSEASAWLNMMQVCVVTEESVIRLSHPVHVTLYDYYLLGVGCTRGLQG